MGVRGPIRNTRHLIPGFGMEWPFEFPRRAPTKTWMMLTFILFVGVAVFVVGLYGSVVLRKQFRQEAYGRLLNETKYILADLERIEPGVDLSAEVARVSRITARRVTVVKEGRLISDWQEGRVVERSNLEDHNAARQAMRSGQGYDEVSDGLTGRRTLFVALASRRMDLIVQVGHVNPPAFAVLERTQMTLFLGMGLALVLTLLGSWIASQKVSRPLHALTTSARRINAGELEEEIAVRSRAAEFQDLARSLDAMAEHFRDDIKQLQRLITIQNEFLGNVSHEVRNPIFAIGGYLEALGSSGLGERQRQRYVQKGIVNLDRLNNLFSDLVEIARLEYREDILQREVFDLQKLVMEVAETARLKAEEKDLLLEVKNPSFHVEADRSRIAQVLTNLIENAIAYTDKGFIRCRLEKEGKVVRVAVSDSGRGIADEHVERIFDRFYRADQARSRTHGGTGLGLSIVKQILHAHGTTIQVESEVGVGTHFWFELPFRPGLIEGDGASGRNYKPEAREV